MKDSIINLRTLFFLVFLASCAYNPKTSQWTKVEAHNIADSIEISQLIAGYNDGDGFSLLLKNDRLKVEARKVTRIAGYPDIVDTLIQTDIHTFKSLRNTTTFLVNDSEVVMTLFQKIIHPSSNWQGQTPWHETIVST